MLQIRRDTKGRVVPEESLFGIDYGCEVDDYLTPLSDEQYSKMAERSKELVHRTLELAGFKNWRACKFGYRIEKLRDSLQNMAQKKKYGRISFQKADKLLEMLIKDLKLVPVDCQFSLDEWGQKAIDILYSFRLAEEKRRNVLRKCGLGY